MVTARAYNGQVIMAGTVKGNSVELGARIYDLNEELKLAHWSDLGANASRMRALRATLNKALVRIEIERR